MILTGEILERNGYVIQKGLKFPFDCTPLYEDENHDVYMCDMGEGFKPRWFFGINGKSEEGEGDNIEDLNMFLQKIGKKEIIWDETSTV